jgi:hypothetical protein
MGRLLSQKKSRDEELLNTTEKPEGSGTEKSAASDSDF